MVRKKSKNKDRPKIIDLPPETLAGIGVLAKEVRMLTKPYIEKLVIDHVKEKIPQPNEVK